MNEIIKKYNIKNWLFFFGMLFIFLFLELFIEIIYFELGGNLKKITLLTSVYLTFFKYFVVILIYAIKYRKYLIEKWKDFLNNFKKYFSITFNNWLSGLLIMFISNIIINMFVQGLGENENSVQLLIERLPVLAFIITTVFAPIVEEMLFRRNLQDCVKRKTLYMVLSGLIFGLIHVIGSENILEYLLIIPYGAVGFMFAKTINETDNIYNTILMHMIHNGILTIISIWGL